MEKQKETLEIEKKQSLSDLEKQTKRAEQLETEKKGLLFEIEKEKKSSQHVLGNL